MSHGPGCSTPSHSWGNTMKVPENRPVNERPNDKRHHASFRPIEPHLFS
eukprot:CAMPEP_0184686260 /NCGR_PEP_ID=MMETSP0312-20130426/21824_1 /TAXON_ID=31354 /ORGANISM="Compsopogon coeruleus, Strain SAG 36.94" /LENGTH=48 /DNA_ID= /DNA_START= /DNA_END= /DNA_ORIENTATION=